MKFDNLSEIEFQQFKRLGEMTKKIQPYTDVDFISIFRILNILEGTNDPYTTCSSCRTEAMTRLRNIYKQYTNEQGI